MKHTPGPWEVGFHSTENRRDGTIIYEEKEGFGIATLWASNRSVEECDANAAFIVKACNSHYDLLEACKDALTCLDKYRPPTAGIPIVNLRDAINKAEGRE